MLEKIALAIFLFFGFILYMVGMRAFIDFCADEEDENKS